MAGLKLVSVNIERSKHLDRVEKFLRTENPDVVCFQELCEHDIPLVESMVGGTCIFARLGKHPSDTADKEYVMTGVAICSKLPITRELLTYYAGDHNDATNAEPRSIIPNSPLLVCSITNAGESYRIATTHFTWSVGGRATDEQRRDMKALLNVLDPIEEFVLTGDFNAPREIDGEKGEIFAMLADKYKDNIPAQYITSIDLDLHRAGKTRAFEVGFRMVDGLFTTPGYIAGDVVLHTGVSDHMAVVATLFRT